MMPYQLATLLYCFNERDEVLLLERAQEPNLGLWSPCGGKLRTDTGESPYACACREAQEELGLALSLGELHLTGLASEHGYQGQSHWLMFLFEVKRKLQSLPPGASRGALPVLPARGAAGAEDSPNGPGEHLALVLATPRRVLRRALPLPPGWAERVDAGRIEDCEELPKPQPPRRGGPATVGCFR